LLPDCECKGRAFLHSLQEITEKKCEKISFAPILPLHHIAKSAVKPIFSPLPHPTFFAPKSPFFALFSVSNPISGDFSRKRSRFCPVKSTFFSSCLVLDQTSDDFSRNISRFSLRSPLFAQHECFSDSCFPHSSRPAPPLPPDLPPSPFIPPPSSLLPHFLSHSSPLFHLSPQLTHERAHPRALRAYAYARTYSHVRRFSFIAFTASHHHHNSLCINPLGVKGNEKKPSQNAQLPHNQNINTKHPISSTVNFISSPR